MTRESIIFLLGFIVFFTPFLGIPREWKEWVGIICGVFLMFLGYSLRRAAFLRSIMSETGEQRSDVFVEQLHNSVSDAGQIHDISHPHTKQKI